MKIIVCCKAVGAGVSKLYLSEVDNKVSYESYSLIMNESDEYALEEALAIKTEFGGEILVILVGNLRCQSVLHTALAKGVDKAIRIDADINDSAIVSDIIAKSIKQMNFEYDLLLTGVESIDNMTAQTGITIAEKLGLPFAFAVTKVDIQNEKKSVIIRKELGHGRNEILNIPLPAALCIQSGIRPLSYVSPIKLMRARKEAIKSIKLDSLGLKSEDYSQSPFKIVKIFEPARVGRCQILEGNLPEIALDLKRKIEIALT